MSSARILIVDDDPQIRRVMRTTLIAQGYEAADAKSGEEAIEKFRENKYDLILLDMNMGGMDGIETCREIRSGSDVAIVMLTVRDAEKDKIAALDAGADDYVTKPFSAPELMARVRAALRRLPNGPESGPQVIKAGDFEIDLQTRRVHAHGKEIRLTPKEFELLRYLVSHPNIPVPHMKLLQVVWGPDYGEEVEYLRVFINQLRKKIELDSIESAISSDRALDRIPVQVVSPKRIVCLTEETTETLYLLGEQDRIVGISGYTVRPPEARLKPKVSAFINAKFDKILALEPDLVLTFSDLQADIAAELIRRGVTVLAFNQRSVAEILDMIQMLASVVGVPEKGRQLVAQMESGLEAIRTSASRFPIQASRPV